MATYIFDGTLTGLLSCVFRAFQFKQFDAALSMQKAPQIALFDPDVIEVTSNAEHAQRVWSALKKKVNRQSLRSFYFTSLAENDEAFNHMFGFAVYVFQHGVAVDQNYGHPNVLGIAQWAKQVGREKHRMEAFVRFKKCQDGLFLSLVQPDFNVLPIIAQHFVQRYQDQRWLIYDEKRDFGIYYDLTQLHQVKLHAQEVDRNIANGHSQAFLLDLDQDEPLYDQLWKAYFRSVNIQARTNLKLHIQYVPKRYWRYMNEKQL